MYTTTMSTICARVDETYNNLSPIIMPLSPVSRERGGPSMYRTQVVSRRG